MWSKWQSHFGLCGLTICETASTWDAVTQIEDNKTNRKESDEDDEEKEGDGGQLVDQSLQSWFFLLLLTSCNSALSQYLQSFHHMESIYPVVAGVNKSCILPPRMATQEKVAVTFLLDPGPLHLTLNVV